jgi:hypothetical protein
MIHPPDCDCDRYGCQLRRKGIMLSYDASPTRRVRRPWRPKVNCSWEAGKVVERRPGGFSMPYVDGTGRPIRQKQWSEQRRVLTEARQRQIQGPALQE